jgi:hypothetical protein
VLCVTLVLVVAQEPSPNLEALHRACLLITQPMAFAAKDECVLEREAAGAARALPVADLKRLVTQDGSLTFATADDALRANACKVIRVRHLPTVRSAPPWLYESCSDSPEGRPLTEMLTDGKITVNKVRHSHRAQCTVSHAVAISGCSVEYVASPLPGRPFVEDLFSNWDWKACGEGQGVRKPDWIATRSGHSCSLSVWMSAEGLPTVCARLATDESSGEVSYYHFAEFDNAVFWVSRVTRFVWDDMTVRVHQIHIASPRLITEQEAKKHSISVGIGDVFCDARARPYKLVEVSAATELKVPYVTIDRQ